MCLSRCSRVLTCYQTRKQESISCMFQMYSGSYTQQWAKTVQSLEGFLDSSGILIADYCLPCRILLHRAAPCYWDVSYCGAMVHCRVPQLAGIFLPSLDVWSIILQIKIQGLCGDHCLLTFLHTVCVLLWRNEVKCFILQSSIALIIHTMQPEDSRVLKLKIDVG